MKLGQLLIGIVLGGLLGYGLTAYYAGTKQQTSDTNKATSENSSSEKWTWPDSLDAVTAAPENHKVVYEDSTLRILQVLLDAGKKNLSTHTNGKASCGLQNRPYPAQFINTT